MPDTPEPTALHRRLDAFAGRWRATGESFGTAQNPDDPRGSAVPWTSEESYEWLPGGFFMLHRWDAAVGDRPFRGVEVLGVDEARGAWFSEMFDDAGNHPRYRISADGPTWTFEEAETRAVVTVLGGGTRMSFRWEWRNGGPAWLPLCDRIATRIG